MNDKAGRPALLLFFLIAFGVPWACWSVLALGWVSAQSPWALALFYSGDFCSIAGLIAAQRAQGWRAVIDLIRRAVDPRAPLLWWGVALLAPLIWQAVSSAIYLTAYGHIGTVDASALRLLASPALLMALTTGPLGEEFGWRGFLFPTLSKRASPLTASLVIGLIWALWHAPIYFQRAIEAPLWAAVFVANVILFSVIISAIYLRSGSLLLAILTHWLINASQEVTPWMFPSLAEGATDTAAFMLIQLAVLFLIALALAPTLRRPLAQHPGEASELPAGNSASDPELASRP